MNKDKIVPKYIAALYWSTRIFTQTCAVFIVIGIIISMFGAPPQIEAPNPQQMPWFFVPWFFCGLLYLIPYKLAVKTKFFNIRLTFYIIISIFFWVYLIVLDFKLSDIIAILILLLALAAPLSLFLFKKYLLVIDSEN